MIVIYITEIKFENFEIIEKLLETHTELLPFCMKFHGFICKTNILEDFNFILHFAWESIKKTLRELSNLENNIVSNTTGWSSIM